MTFSQRRKKNKGKCLPASTYALFSVGSAQRLCAATKRHTFKAIANSIKSNNRKCSADYGRGLLVYASMRGVKSRLGATLLVYARENQATGSSGAAGLIEDTWAQMVAMMALV